MKNKFLLAAALLITAAAGAQTPTNPTTPTTPNPNQTKQDTAVLPTILIDSSVNSAYVSNPEQLKGLTTETLKPEHAFPAIGSYTASGTSTGNVTITLDPENKGIVWVEGLPQGKFKALMKKAPSTYKVPAQKTEEGKSVAEGSLFLNPTSKELTILLGRPFDDADPTSFLNASSKSKNKVQKYTGVKTEVNTVVTPNTQQ
jgi:hypothetical protein